jgi:DNA gyrase subunit A
MATRRGLVKKTRLEEYSRPRSGGIIGINLDDGDTLIDVVLTARGDEVLLATRHGMAIRFSESDVRPTGRATRGVKGITLADTDELVGMVVADPDGSLLTVCANGYGKRTPFGPNTTDSEVALTDTDDSSDDSKDQPSNDDESAEPDLPSDESDADENPTRSHMRYRRQRRGGKGVRDIRTSERNGPVIGIVAVRDGDEIMLITAQGMVNRTHVDEIRLVGRNTQGVRIMNLNEGDRLASVARIAREELDETAQPDPTPDPSQSSTLPPAPTDSHETS